VTPRLIGCALLLLPLAPIVAACPGKTSNVKVTVAVILACDKGKTIDKRLKQIASEIQLVDPSLTSFELHKMSERSVAPLEKTVFDLPDSKQAVVVIRHGADEGNKVSLGVKPPDQGEIIYSTVCGKFLPIVCSYKTKAGKHLILAICVEPCKGK
jgi:hypothetical protein